MSKKKDFDVYDDEQFGDEFFEEVDVTKEGNDEQPSIFDTDFNEVEVENIDFFKDTDATNVFSDDDEITAQQKANFNAFKELIKSGEFDINKTLGIPGVKLAMVEDDDLLANREANLENMRDVTPGEGEDITDVYPQLKPKEDEIPTYEVKNVPFQNFVTPQTVASTYILENYARNEKHKLTEAQKEELSFYQLINRFRLITDNNSSFKGFSISGKYDFDNPPILHFEENFAVVLEPELLVRILVTLCDSMRLPSLHACQLGLKYDVFVVKLNREQYAQFFNSELLGVSESGNKQAEICGSYPGLAFQIERPNYVEAVYRDAHGEEKEHRIDDDVARYFIQNWALTRGKTIFDFVSPLAKSMGIKKRNKLKHKLENEYETY